ncbi:zinc-binding dehydrogenase [Streptomyces cirratus]
MATPVPRLAHRPQNLDAVHAAAIPESGMTAVCLLRAVGLTGGESVLVIGATGGVGLYAVQLAHALRARVIATATAQDADYICGLGAADTVDYRQSDVVEETLKLVPDGVDVVVDLVNRGEGLAAVARAARPGGRLVSPLSGPDDLGRGVTPVYIGSFVPEPGDLEDLASRAADGGLRVEIGAATRSATRCRRWPTSPASTSGARSSSPSPEVESCRTVTLGTSAGRARGRPRPIGPGVILAPHLHRTRTVAGSAGRLVRPTTREPLHDHGARPVHRRPGGSARASCGTG